MKQSVDGVSVRLSIEEKQLKDRTYKLNQFMKSKQYDLLNDNVRELMEKQLKAMKEYYEALTARMEMMGIEISD